MACELTAMVVGTELEKVDSNEMRLELEARSQRTWGKYDSCVQIHLKQPSHGWRKAMEEAEKRVVGLT
jgi:hypothetical protein